ncbi:MAG TPA: hypothetical protein VLJ68_05040, partial [Chitinophagaceae bacterium]|nr:hypothetical protein [Chitinophagaceae bacterium]
MQLTTQKFLILTFFSLLVFTQRGFSQRSRYTHQDTLRGSINAERDWWDVYKYNLHVTPVYSAKTISGMTEILFTIKKEGNQKIMQID